MINNQNGQMTIDFIFGLVLMAGFAAVLFALSFTLTVSEIAQYVTFAAARNYYAGNLTLKDQETAGKAKYASLTNNKVIKPLFSGSWFSLSKEVTLGASTSYVEAPDVDSDIFVGAEATFSAPILKFKVPFFGSTSKKDKVFTAQIHSWIQREPTTEECVKFNQARWSMILQLETAFQKAKTGNDTAYAVMTDNGC
jgi:hypothetical protein